LARYGIPSSPKQSPGLRRHTIRRVGTDDVKVVDWDEPWQRRKAEALAMEQVQRRLALIPGEVLTVPTVTAACGGS